MAKMLIKFSPGQYQCGCCDARGVARRKGKKSQRRKEERAWRNEYRKGEA